MQKVLLKKESRAVNKKNNRLVAPEDARIFFELFQAVDLFVGRNAGIFDQIKKEGKPIEINEFRKMVHDVLFSNRALLDQFVLEDGKELSEEEKHIVLDWKSAVYGNFLCHKYYPDYAVMSSFDSPDIFYGVLGLTEDFKVVFPMSPPYIIKTALLPFKGKIIWSGLSMSYNMGFGKNMRETFLDDCQNAREKGLIKTSL